METRENPRPTLGLYKYTTPLNEDEFLTGLEKRMYIRFVESGLRIGEDVVKAKNADGAINFNAKSVKNNKFFVLPERLAFHFTSHGDGTTDSGVSGSSGGRIKRKSTRHRKRRSHSKKRRYSKVNNRINNH